MESLILKAGREKSALNFHPWVFSGAVAEAPKVANGSLVQVKSASGQLIGSGYYNAKSSIVCRLLSFGERDPEEELFRNLEAACALRKRLLASESTNTYRLVNAEGDGIPGLIVDRYAEVLVIQIGTLGIEKLKEKVVSWLTQHFNPECIYEKSSQSSRRDEGLSDSEGVLYGKLPTQLKVKENGILFEVLIPKSQKTGLFLDQRENRAKLEQLVRAGRFSSVLNCFSFSAGFSLYAARGGALSIDSVDISETAVAQANANFALNKIVSAEFKNVAADVFEYLREMPREYDLIVLDPPAFAKKREQVTQACRGYKEINRLAIANVKPGGIVATFSCSAHVDEKLFRQVVFQAAKDAGRKVRIIGRHQQGIDHPVNLYHPEGDYLKGLFLQVEE